MAGLQGSRNRTRPAAPRAALHRREELRRGARPGMAVGVRVALAGHGAGCERPMVLPRRHGDTGLGTGEEHESGSARQAPGAEQGSEHAHEQRLLEDHGGADEHGPEQEQAQCLRRRGPHPATVPFIGGAGPGFAPGWRAMRSVPADALPQLRPWFAPERPGPLIFEHVVRTGHGRCRVDRWPHPQVVLAELPGNYALAVTRASGGRRSRRRGRVRRRSAGVAARPAHPGSGNRCVGPAGRRAPGRCGRSTPGDHVRLLTPADAPALAALGAEDAWIHETWGGVAGLLAAGVAYAGIVDGGPVSIAVPFFVGGEYEDIGVVTVRAHRRRGLSTASAAAVVRDIRARGHVPTWTTSPDNTGSRAVAARLGFTHVRDDVLYAVRTPIPV